LWGLLLLSQRVAETGKILLLLIVTQCKASRVTPKVTPPCLSAI
jgi:hypothetical protein